MSSLQATRPVISKKAIDFFIVIICMLVSGIWAVMLGEDINWDLKNYHYYNPFAFLEGRLLYEYAPAQAQSYNNPLLDLPVYWLIQYCPPKCVGFILGAVQGLNIFLIYLLMRILFSFYPSVYKELLILVGCFTAYYAAANLSEVGATFGDNVVSLLILFPFYRLISNWKSQEGNQNAEIKIPVFVYTGLIMGIAVGLKLTLAIFPVAAAIAVAWISSGFWAYLRSAIVFSGAVFIGFVTSIGFWMYFLWRNFSNPLFPYFNHIFKSSYYKERNFADTRFLPDDIWQTIFYPFYFIVRNSHVCELEFRDIRLAVCYVLFVVFIGYIIYRKIKKSPAFQQQNSALPLYLFIITFFVLAYVFWEKLFSIYRYVVVLEFLTPVFILMILDIFPVRKKITAVVFMMLSLFIVYMVIPMDWGRLSWEKSYFGVQTSRLKSLKGANVVMMTYEPLSYLVPFFPESTKFLRVEGNFSAPEDTTLFMKQIRQQMQSNPRNYILLYNTSQESLSRFEKHFPYSIDTTGCIHFDTRLDKDLRIARLKKN